VALARAGDVEARQGLRDGRGLGPPLI
jgi:hypothetical protein